MSEARILIIYTGGTIGMIENPETQSLKPFDFAHLFNEIPELKKFNYELTTHSFEEPIDSSNMSPDIWIQLASLISENYKKYDGFVILHGSDTMAYTASALSFLLENLSKPVILTGSQLPIGTVRTDGKENLITAIEIAAARYEDRAAVPEVAIYFEYNLYRGNRTKKIDSEDFEAFQSLNYPLLAVAGVSIKYDHHNIQLPSELPFRVHTKMDDSVAILKLYPGINLATVNAMVNIPGLKGLIIETYGSGNAPTDQWLLDELKYAIDSGIIVLNITQCYGGSVVQGKYETSLMLQIIGVIGGADMTTEAALTKLMYLLASGMETDEIKSHLLQNLRGELT